MQRIIAKNFQHFFTTVKIALQQKNKKLFLTQKEDPFQALNH